MKNKARVHRLPTEDKSQVHYNKVKYPTEIKYKLSFHKELSKCKNDGLCSGNQHLYITTDEVAKKGDYYIHQDLGKQPIVKILEVEGEFLVKKIIAATNPKLKPKCKCSESEEICKSGHCLFSLPQIPQSFIEEYCKAGGIDKILVEHELNVITSLELIRGDKMRAEASDFQPKLDSNNCIIIHPVEEKMYSREEMISFAKYAIKNGFGLNHTENLLDKWIEENF